MDRASPVDRFADLLAWIEDRLDQPLSLDQVAARAGLSPYHCSRLFTARMGRSLMVHVRGRRLVRAARRMAAEPDLKLIDLALDCGFESQEAFTRAFTRSFGVSPGRFRHGYSISPLEGAYSMSLPDPTGVRVDQRPDLIRREAFSLAGFSRRYDQQTKSTIPQLWSRLIAVMPFPGQAARETYGVVWGADRAEGTFSYMAAGVLASDAPTPEGLERKDLDAQAYVVFRITLAGGPVHPQVRDAMALIWGDLTPASGLTVVDAPDFEVYDGKARLDQPGAVIDFYIPVQE